MEDENNKQAEARRVLDAIRQKEAQVAEEETVPQKPVQWLIGEDAAQLQALVDQSRGVKIQPEVKEELPDPESIDPISAEQVKELRKFANGKKEVVPHLKETIYGAIIRSFCEAVDFFKPSVRAQRCIVEGHQCLHCGQKFSASLVPPAAPDAPATPESKSHSHPKH